MCYLDPNIRYLACLLLLLLLLLKLLRMMESVGPDVVDVPGVHDLLAGIWCRHDEEEQWRHDDDK